MTGIALCRVCLTRKDVEDFYPRQLRVCRTVGECKDCTKRRVINRARTDPNVQAYDRARSKLPHRKELHFRITRKWREENPQAYRAHTALNNAVRDGRVKKSPCVVCGSTDKLEAHHADYSKPLDVTWYCSQHHHWHHADSGYSVGVNRIMDDLHG